MLFGVALLESGWADLAAGRWESARRTFESLLATGEAPEALEGLSWAAWWQDDVETVFDARERAFRLYRTQGDAASAARMATWLAGDELDFRGAFAVAAGWLRRAQRLLEPLDESPDHGWLAFHQGYAAYAQGDREQSLELAQRTARLGRQFDVPDLEMLGLALQGSLLVANAQVQEGMACLDEATATALAGEAAIPIARAWTCCFLVTACETVRDYARAFEWCDRIADFAQRYQSRYMLGWCGAHYGMIHLARGRWSDAEVAFEAAAEDYARSRPSFIGEAVAGLAELRRRQGRWDEAERLLDSTGGGAATLCRARLAMDRDQPRLAIDMLERLLRQSSSRPRPASAPALHVHAPALELLVHARAALGDVAKADAPLAELRRLARIIGTAPMLASAELAEGVLAAAGGELVRARGLVERAIDGFDQHDAPYEVALSQLALAAILSALGDGDAARREAEASRATCESLGAAPAARRARRLLDEPNDSARPAMPLRLLTRRERDVLRRVAAGLTNPQVADRLMVSEHTVHRHVSSILRKLDVPTRAAAVAVAVRAGLKPEA